MAVPGADLAFNITFGMVILSLLVQGATIPLMSRLFRVWVPTNNEPKAEHEISVADQANITYMNLKSNRVHLPSVAILNPSRVNLTPKPYPYLHWCVIISLLMWNEDTILKMGDVVWYAMRGDDAPSIAKILIPPPPNTKKIVSFMAIGYCLLMHAL